MASQTAKQGSGMGKAAATHKKEQSQDRKETFVLDNDEVALLEFCTLEYNTKEKAEGID